MKLRWLLASSCIFAAMAVSVAPATAAVHECVSGPPTAASYTWNFKSEANTLFADVEFDAQQALDHANQLQMMANEPTLLDWTNYLAQLDPLKTEINDIGTKLCRLETIRRIVAPWQQQVIDKITMNALLMAQNAQDAIVFGNAHQHNLWLAPYRQYLNNLYHEAHLLTRSVRTRASS